MATSKKEMTYVQLKAKRAKRKKLMGRCLALVLVLATLIPILIPVITSVMSF